MKTPEYITMLGLRFPKKSSLMKHIELREKVEEYGLDELAEMYFRSHFGCSNIDELHNNIGIDAYIKYLEFLVGQIEN